MSLPTWLEEIGKKSEFANHALLLKLSAKALPVRNAESDLGKACPYIEIRKGHGMVKEGKDRNVISSLITVVGTAGLGALVGTAAALNKGKSTTGWAIGGCIFGAGAAVLSTIFQSDFTLKSFIEPKEGQYMGTLDRASLIYDGLKDFQKLTLDPKWSTIEIADLSRLCDGGDIKKPILIDVWDHVAGKVFGDAPPVLMGYALVSVWDLLTSHHGKKEIPLRRGGDPSLAWGGSLVVEDAELVDTSSFYWQLRRTARRLFDTMDVNRDGVVVRSEIWAAMSRRVKQQHGDHVPHGAGLLKHAQELADQETVARLVKDFFQANDHNHDQQVSWDEYWAGIWSNPLLDPHPGQSHATEADFRRMLLFGGTPRCPARFLPAQAVLLERIFASLKADTNYRA